MNSAKIRIGNIIIECDPKDLKEVLYSILSIEELRRLVIGTVEESQREIEEEGGLDNSIVLLREPSVWDIASYIENKGFPFRHNMKEIIEHFLGIEGSLKKQDIRTYYRLQYIVSKARKYLERKYRGKFVSEIIAIRENNITKPYRVYWMVREKEKEGKEVGVEEERESLGVTPSSGDDEGSVDLAPIRGYGEMPRY